MKLECVAHCEIDKNASKFYNENNKGSYGKHYSDVSKINTRVPFAWPLYISLKPEETTRGAAPHNGDAGRRAASRPR